MNPKDKQAEIDRIRAARMRRMAQSLDPDWVEQRMHVITHRLIVCMAFGSGFATGLLAAVLYHAIHG